MKAKPEKERGTLPLPHPCTPEDIIDRARQYGSAALEALADVMENGTDATRVSAANAMLDRGFGKVGQPLEITGADGSELSLELGVSPSIATALKAIQGAMA